MERNGFSEAQVRLGFSSSDSVCREKMLLTKSFPQDFFSSDVSFTVTKPLCSAILCHKHVLSTDWHTKGTTWGHH